MDEIAARAGLSVTYHFEKDWAAVITAVRTGKADIAPVVGITAERQKILSFTTTVDTYPLVIFVRSNDHSISALRNDLRVGVIEGSSAHEIIKKKHGKVSFRTLNGYSDGLFNLLAGNIDAFCCAPFTLLGLARDAGVEDKIKIVGAPIMELKRGMAVRKDDAKLLAKLNDVTEGFVGSPEYQRIYMKWFGSSKPFMAVSKKTLLRTIVIFMIIGGMALWRYISVTGLNRKLQQEISERVRAEDTLREKNTMLHTLIHAIPDQVIFKDFAGRYLLVNKAMEETFGLGQEAFVGKTDDDISPPDVADKCKKSDAKAIKSGGPACSEECYTDKNGEVRFLDVVKAPIHDAKGDLKGLVVVSHDITDRRRTNDALRESERRYRILFDQSPDGILLIDAAGKILEFNETAHRQLGYSREEFARLRVSDINPIESPGEIRDRIRKIHETGQARFDVKHRTKQGELRDVYIITQAMILSDRPVVYAIWHDITDRKLAEKTLRETNKSLSALIRYSPLAIISIGIDGRVLIWNPAAERIFGWTEGEVLGRENPIVPEDRRDEYFRLTEDVVSDHPYLSREITRRKKDGTLIQLNAASAAIQDDNGNAIALFGIFEDISERKHAEELIRRALQEKEVMLKEIHHRVKNNMQVIYSLLNLKAKSATDSAVRDILEESRDRVHSMSLIHETLYRSEDLAHVDFKTYLLRLIQGISSTYKRHDVQVLVDMEPVSLDVNTGIPCGLIANELVSNSLKYAFPEGRSGTIKVGISNDVMGNKVLSVEDNGIGLPATLDFRNTASLGLQLVTVLTGQINGTIELTRTEGTRFSITIPG